LWSPKFYRPVLPVVRQAASDHGIIASNVDVIGVMFSCLAGRPTSCALFREVKPFAYVDPLRTAAVFVYVKDVPAAANSHVPARFKARHWSLIAETPVFLIFRNESGPDRH